MSPKDFIQSAWQWGPTIDSVVKTFQGRSASCEVHSKGRDLGWVRERRPALWRTLFLVLPVSVAQLASFVLAPSFLCFFSILTAALTKGSGTVLSSNFKSGSMGKLKLS